MAGIVVEYIVYTDRHENFPRDREAQSTQRGRCCMRRPIYGTGSASRTVPNLCRGIYNMRFHVQSAGISLLGGTI